MCTTFNAVLPVALSFSVSSRFVSFRVCVCVKSFNGAFFYKGYVCMHMQRRDAGSFTNELSSRGFFKRNDRRNG